MEKRVMEKLGSEVSLLGFGCMRFPMNGDGYDMAQVQEMIDLAYENGVNYYDTAYVYGEDGMSEKAMGEALKKYPRNSFYTADKLPFWLAKKQDDLQTFFNTSLERLGMDYIDYYLMHAIDKGNWELVKKYDVINFCKKLRDEGKIRYIGFSFHDSPELFREVVDSFDWDFVQIQLNYFDWEAQRAKELYDIINEKGLSCVVMEPIRGGTLANPIKEIKDVFKSVRPELSPSSWALRYCGSLPRIKVILSGMSNISHVKDNLSTMNNFTPLSKEEYAAIDKVVKIINAQPQIGCTGCHYCMPCPHGVDIPANFSAYNDYMKLRDKNVLKWKLNNELKDKGMDKCVKCGVCATHCPQHLKIPEELLKVAAIKKETGI